ncbi:MAG: response regulator transcription factor [Deltaproteobacteria bacterium]|nr:response regulator transcription factor [Deltaproteobacteria bacterium]
MIKVGILCSHLLFSEGIRSLLGDDNEIEVVNSYGEGAEIAVKNGADVMLVETPMLADILPALKDTQVKALVLDSREQELLNLFSSGNVAGLIPPWTTPLFLKKAIRAVKDGELWIERKSIKSIFSEVWSQSESAANAKKIVLSKRELEIAKYVIEGKSNKEIANMLSLSEQTIKAHLNRIYKKSDVKTRVKLAIYLQPLLSENN